jgi:hypothetical protein
MRITTVGIRLPGLADRASKRVDLKQEAVAIADGFKYFFCDVLDIGVTTIVPSRCILEIQRRNFP